MTVTAERATPVVTTALERVVTARGQRIRVVTWGDGPPLLMINGIGGHVAMWQPLAAELSQTHQLVMFDAPGCGKSPPLRTPLRMPGLARLVVAILDELGIDQVDLLGYSWGGAVAQQLAHDFPDRVRRLVLASTVPGLGGWPPKLRVAALMATPMRFQSRRMTGMLAAQIYGGDYRQRLAPTGRARLEHWNDYPPSALAYSQQIYAISGWTSLPWLGRVRASTLILCGDDDPLAPRTNAWILARFIPRSQLRMIPNAGHLWLLDHARESAALVEGFLAGASVEE
jgi:pimeloyl-ACP methyl ester carboxylesterase